MSVFYEDCFCCQAELIKNRGWTKTMVDKYAKVAKVVKNPHCRYAAPMKLYLRNDIEYAEKQPDFLKDYGKLQSRRNKIQSKIVDSHSPEFLRKACSIIDSLTLPAMTMDEVVDAMIEVKSPHCGDMSEIDDRIVVNFIRHHLMPYDIIAQEISKEGFDTELYLRLCRKTYDLIAKVFPELGEECSRQLQQKMAYPHKSCYN